MLMPLLSRRASGAALVVLAVVSSACTEDGVGPVPVIPVTRTVTVNAASAFSYLALDTVAQPVTVGDPGASTVWDLGLFATTVTTNGGAAGPAGVRAACLCQNASATNAEVAGMTAAGQLAAFEAVTAADIPADSQFVSDALAPAVSGWYSGTPGPTVTVTPSRAWIVREGSATTVLAKLRVASIQAPTATAPGSVTIEYAVQPAAGDPFGPVQSVQIATAGGPVYFDLTTGSVSSAANWDLKFDGWDIRLNSGVSGGGTVRAVLDTSTPFASIDASYAATAPAQAFSADRYSGAFGVNPWYRYNVTGTDNQIWPVFNVYLVRRGTAVYKVQLIGYYGADGTARQITLRYAKLSN